MNVYPVPGFQSWSEIKRSGKLFVKFNKRIQTRLITFSAISTFLTSFIINRQYKEFLSMNQKLYERDEKLRKRAAEMLAERSKPKLT